MKRPMLGIHFIWVMLLLFHLGLFSFAHAQQVIRGHIPSAISQFGLRPVGRMDSTKQMRIAIGLPLRNHQALTTLLQEMYDPASRNFRQYLTTEQFTEEFGPTDQDYQSVISFAKANGLK